MLARIHLKFYFAACAMSVLNLPRALANILPSGGQKLLATDMAGTVSEGDFQEILKTIEGIYSEEVAALGGTLRIKGEWVYPEFGASAQRLNENWLVTVYGGVARYSGMNVDALAFVVCHELGHFLGGAPKKSQILWKDWASAEGQADYFAGSKCFPRFVTAYQAQPMGRTSVSQTVRRQCENLQNNAAPEPGRGTLDCVRTAAAAYTTYESVRRIMNEKEAISFDKKDLKIVTELNEKYGSAQCRLDTALAGIWCPKSQNEKFDDENPRQGSCHEGFFSEFARPRCWYVETP